VKLNFIPDALAQSALAGSRSPMSISQAHSPIAFSRRIHLMEASRTNTKGGHSLNDRIAKTRVIAKQSRQPLGAPGENRGPKRRPRRRPPISNPGGFFDCRN
jgi:hypothetical protein